MKIQHPQSVRPGALSRHCAAVALVALALAGCAHVPGVYTYEGRPPAGGSGGPFSAVAYAQGIFASKILPTVQDKAIDAATLLSAIKADPEAAGAKYGKRSGVGAPYAFLIKGSGTVSKVDSTDPTGPVTVLLDGGAGTITIATGPVLLGTDLRDAVGFIDFGQFSNQIDYADVATQINAQVKTVVLAKVDRATLTGKKIRFAGAFSLSDPSAVVVIPTTLTVA